MFYLNLYDEKSEKKSSANYPLNIDMRISRRGFRTKLIEKQLQKQFIILSKKKKCRKYVTGYKKFLKVI